MISKDFDNCQYGCWECFDGYMFSLAHDLHVAQKYVSSSFYFSVSLFQKKYNLDTLNGWCKNMAKNIPPNKHLNMSQIPDIFQCLQKR